MNIIKQYANTIIALAVLALLVAGAFGVRAYNDSLREEGRAEIRAEWQAANAQAVEKQASQNDEATKETIVTETVIETQYRDRIKEVIRYVPTPGTVCPADAEFVRLFNTAAR